MAVLRFRKSELFTPAERVALEVAEAMTETPQQVTDDLFHRLQEHYSDAEIVEMSAVIALENFRSRFNRCGRAIYRLMFVVCEVAGVPSANPRVLRSPSFRTWRATNETPH